MSSIDHGRFVTPAAAESFAALAGPPLSPPLRPNATAAGSLTFSGFGGLAVFSSAGMIASGFSPIASWKTAWESDRVAGPLRALGRAHPPRSQSMSAGAGEELFVEQFKLTHYPLPDANAFEVDPSVW